MFHSVCVCQCSVKPTGLFFAVTLKEREYPPLFLLFIFYFRLSSWHHLPYRTHICVFARMSVVVLFLFFLGKRVSKLALFSVCACLVSLLYFITTITSWISFWRRTTYNLILFQSTAHSECQTPQSTVSHTRALSYCNNKNTNFENRNYLPEAVG